MSLGLSYRAATKRRAAWRWLTRFVAAWLCVSLSWAPASVQAGPAEEAAAPDPTDPDALSAAAVTKFRAGEYEEAVSLFQKAYALDPQPNYLFNIGRVHEEAGNIEAAVHHYERFVREPGVDLAAREQAVERLEVLRKVLDATKQDEAPPPAEDDPKDDPVQPPLQPDKPKKRSKVRIAGYVLLGVGLAAVAVGAGFAGEAKRRENQLDDFQQLEPRQDVIDRGRRNAIAADVLFATGGVIAGTGLIMILATLGKKNRGTRAGRWQPVLSQSTVGVAYGRRF